MVVGQVQHSQVGVAGQQGDALFGEPVVGEVELLQDALALFR